MTKVAALIDQLMDITILLRSQERDRSKVDAKVWIMMLQNAFWPLMLALQITLRYLRIRVCVMETMIDISTR